MIGIMAQVAQWEREQISKRTKAALSVAKERGMVLGGDRGNLPGVAPAGAAMSALTRRRTAEQRAEKVRPYVAQARSEGHRSLRSLAAYLNRKGIRTSRGAEWDATAVRRLMVAA
jgi:DNA invertase Pin-like site-specific DNA recombinase